MQMPLLPLLKKQVSVSLLMASTKLQPIQSQGKKNLKKCQRVELVRSLEAECLILAETLINKLSILQTVEYMTKPFCYPKILTLSEDSRCYDRTGAIKPSQGRRERSIHSKSQQSGRNYRNINEAMSSRNKQQRYALENLKQPNQWFNIRKSLNKNA